MIFWIFLILLNVGLIVTIILAHKNNRLSGFSLSLTTLFAIVVFGMLLFIVAENIRTETTNAIKKQEYNELLYKIQRDGADTHFDEISQWNKNLIRYQTNARNLWIGIFYSEKTYEGLEIIALPEVTAIE